MHKYLSLTKVLCKCSMGMLKDGKAKSKAMLLLYGFLCLCMIPIPIGIYAMISSMLSTYAQIDQLGSVLGSVLFLASLLIFMFSLLLIPSIFYFSNDNPILLALPLKPEQILAGKFSVCVLYEYGFCLFLLVPAYAAYIQFAAPAPFFYVAALLTFLLLPIYPLVLSTLLTILIMRFIPFFKNRDRFQMVSSILIVVAALAISFYSQSMSTSDPDALMHMLLEGNNSMLSFYAIMFPPLPYFARAMSEVSVIQLLLAIGIVLLSLVILMTFAKFLYFKGAIGFGESAGFHKELSKEALQNSTHVRSKLLSYARKEIMLLFRTPVYFLNCISICIIMPALLVLLPMLSGGENMDLQVLFSLLDPSVDILPYSIFIGIGAGFFLGTLNSISATAISREGSHIDYMKYIPMSFKDQIHAKSICGIAFGILTLAFTLLSLMLILPLSLIHYGIIFLCGCISTVLGNEAGIIFDVLHPKLVWEQEAAAVKQNMGAMLMMFSGMALCFVCIGICFIIPRQALMIAALISLFITLFLAVISWIGAGRIAEAGMRKL